MLDKIIKTILGKSIAKDVMIMVAKNSNKNESVVKEKLGVSTIDEFMKLDIHEYRQKKKAPSL